MQKLFTKNWSRFDIFLQCVLNIQLSQKTLPRFFFTFLAVSTTYRTLCCQIVHNTPQSKYILFNRQSISKISRKYGNSFGSFFVLKPYINCNWVTLSLWILWLCSYCSKKPSGKLFSPECWPVLTVMVKHDGHAMTWYDHGKTMAWSSWNIAWWPVVVRKLIIQPTVLISNQVEVR